MVNGFIVYPTYKIDGNHADVYLLGRLEDGQSFLSIHPFRPYFYIPAANLLAAKKLLPASIEFIATNQVNFHREPVAKVIAALPKDVPGHRKILTEAGIPCYEADIRYAIRFLIDNHLKGGITFSDQPKPNIHKDFNVSVVFNNPVFTPNPSAVPLRLLSFDIETDMKAKQLFSVSFFGKEFSRVYIISDKPVKDAIAVPDEPALLTSICKAIEGYDPDVIVGWNCIDFDLSVLRTKFAQHTIPFRFGRLPWDVTLRLQESFFIDSSADVPGRMVLDGIHLLKSSFIKLPDYKLATASAHFLGESKLIEGNNRFMEIERLFREDPAKLAAYNLKDSELVYNIFLKSGLLDLTILRSQLTRMPIDRVSSSVASLDSLYLEELQHRKGVAPSANVQEREERIAGGYVMTSKPGIYNYILVFDFKSLYPSIIRTFNIDPWSYLPHDQRQQFNAQDMIVAPNGACFRREEGILPQLIERLWQERDIAKKHKDLVRSNAIKITMNSFFGVLANPACRFYSTELANAITHFGQSLIKQCAHRLEQDGYTIIYGDTDSLFIDPHAADEKTAMKHAKKVFAIIESYLDTLVTKEYKQKNFMELEFDKLYTRFLLPKIRDSEIGAKKRYAGMIVEDGKEEIEFVGLESVRRDWTALAKHFQEQLVKKVFHNEEVGAWVKSFVADVRSGKHDSLLVYRKAIRKKVENYTKTTPPHIQAARKAGIVEVGVIDYTITMHGPEVVGMETARYDYEHYIEKQIKPIADSVLALYGQPFESLISGHKQSSLGDF